MGKIDSIYILDNVKCKIANIQELSLKKITELFIEIDVNNLTFDCTEGIGVRGVYEDLPNNQLEIKFKYNDLKFEFYLSFDQLEYHILRNSKKVSECIVEDFLGEDMYIKKFIQFLKSDLIKLGISFN